MDEKVIGYVFACKSQGVDGALQVDGVPKNDRGGDQVTYCCTQLMVLVGPISECPSSEFLGQLAV